MVREIEGREARVIVERGEVIKSFEVYYSCPGVGLIERFLK